MPFIPQDVVDQLTGDLVAIVKDVAGDLLEGAAADMQTYALAIGTDMARALLSDSESVRKALMEELVAQLVAVGEINRIRAEQAMWHSFQRVIAVAGNVLLRAAVALV